MAHPESVLEHSASVAMLSYFVGRRLVHAGVDVDFEVLTLKALFHDSDEVITGDIARPVKYHSAELRSLLGEMEHENVKKLSVELTGEDHFYQVWEGAKNNPEGFIVKLCDALSVVYKIRDEVLERGNLSMCHIATNKLLDYINQTSADIYLAYDIETLEIDNPLIPIVTECSTIISKIKSMKNRN
tara:strand:- start:126 stop:683 length:558 start_codon:yes stop_codon:yes gene_type:complete